MRFPAIQGKLTGVVVPVSALRGKNDLGVGEFPDLIELGEWAAKTGIKVIQILPVNDSGYQSSPYSALTAFALHPIYLSLKELPETRGFAEDLAQLTRRFQSAARFPYNAVLEAKLTLLKRIYLKSIKDISQMAATGQVLDLWIADNSWVKEYAVYRRLKDLYGDKHWREWPEFSRVSPDTIEALWAEPALRDDHLFWTWLQFRLDGQFKTAADALAASGIILKGDLPILMNEDSCDVWAHPEYFRSDLCAGAPPDMFSPLGQNWQFPIYDWDALAADDYRWWRRRLLVADRYYAAYRIDHVLGFFRIWALSRRDQSAVLGCFLPSEVLKRDELYRLGFNAERLRWLSLPHIATSAVRGALLEKAGLSGTEVDKVFTLALERINNEELWLFKPVIRGERDIEVLPLHFAAKIFLQSAWRDRALLEFENDAFVPTWTYWDTRSFASLGTDERRNLDSLIKRKRVESETVWEEQGRRLLRTLRETTPMLACAEDLGAVPDCVPRTLAELGILGLRVFRWARRWGSPDEPFIPLSEYPELSVCTPAVHDSSTVREWWEREVDRKIVKRFLNATDLPDTYSPAIAEAILGAIAEARSRLCVFQIQDLLHLSAARYAVDPASERINVPGSVNDFNWTYRLPAPIDEITSDHELIEAIRRIVGRR